VYAPLIAYSPIAAWLALAACIVMFPALVWLAFGLRNERGARSTLETAVTGVRQTANDLADTAKTTQVRAPNPADAALAAKLAEARRAAAEKAAAGPPPPLARVDGDRAGVNAGDPVPELPRVDETLKPPPADVVAQRIAQAIAEVQARITARGAAGPNEAEARLLGKLRADLERVRRGSIPPEHAASVPPPPGERPTRAEGVAQAAPGERPTAAEVPVVPVPPAVQAEAASPAPLVVPLLARPAVEAGSYLRGAYADPRREPEDPPEMPPDTPTEVIGRQAAVAAVAAAAEARPQPGRDTPTEQGGGPGPRSAGVPRPGARPPASTRPATALGRVPLMGAGRRTTLASIAPPPSPPAPSRVPVVAPLQDPVRSKHAALVDDAAAKCLSVHHCGEEGCTRDERCTHPCTGCARNVALYEEAYTAIHGPPSGVTSRPGAPSPRRRG